MANDALPLEKPQRDAFSRDGALTSRSDVGVIEPGDLVIVRGYNSLRRVVGLSQEEVHHLPLESHWKRAANRTPFEYCTLAKKARYENLLCRICNVGNATTSGLCSICEEHEAAMADTP